MAIDPAVLYRAPVILGRLAAVGAAGLAVTGVPLMVLYEPRGGAAWLRTLHSASSTLFLGATAGLLLVAAVVAIARHRTWLGWPLALGAFAAAAVGSFTGQLLAWDMLALTAVTVGETYRGVIDPLTADVRFVIVGSAEVSQRAYLGWLLVHLVVVPAAATLVGRSLWRRWRRWRAWHTAAVERADATGVDSDAPLSDHRPEPGQAATS